jgi:uncharacterized membrane protein YdjX (TVP38/TMEM64 family)
MREFLVARPVWLFIVLVILPGFPVPASALFLVAGVAWGDEPWMACLYGWAALCLNQAWTYALASGPARPVVIRLVRRVGWEMPTLESESVADILWLVRLIPGIPLFLQNYLLGVLRVPYRKYFWVSLVCNGPPVAGVILTGAGIAGGEWTTALSGLVVMMLAVVAVRVWRRKRVLPMK